MIKASSSLGPEGPAGAHPELTGKVCVGRCPPAACRAAEERTLPGRTCGKVRRLAGGWSIPSASFVI